jgi:hypothetical protein
VTAALEAKLSNGIEVESLDEATMSPAQRADYERLQALLRAVRETLGAQKKLPTLEERLPLSIGGAGRWLAVSHGARYAFAVRMKDCQLSSGAETYNWNRVFDSFDGNGLRSTSIWIGGDIHGTGQGATAVLADLEDGRIVWCNFRWGLPGDIRTSEGADVAVDALLRSSIVGAVRP